MADDKRCFNFFLPNMLKQEQVTVFDVGANIEELALFDYTNFMLTALRPVKNVKVFGVEPVHYGMYEKMYENNPQVEIVKQALGEEQGEMTLFMPRSTGLSSFYKRKCFKQWEAEGSSEILELNIDVITLDSFASFKKLESIDYLKLDAEGAEFNILKGSTRCLREKIIKAGHFECGETFADAGVELRDMVGFLEDHGYTCHQNNLNTILKSKEINQPWIQDHIVFKTRE